MGPESCSLSHKRRTWDPLMQRTLGTITVLREAGSRSAIAHLGTEATEWPARVKRNVPHGMVQWDRS